MAYEKRKTKEYYYRSRRLADGRIVKTYHGSGQRAALASDADRILRGERSLGVQRHRILLESVQRIATPHLELFKNCDAVIEAALLAAGYHKHRGQWREKRHGRLRIARARIVT